MTSLVVFDMEVDVVRERAVRPWVTRTHYVQVGVDDHPSWERLEIEARNVAVWMCWHVRGDMVTAVRITGVEL